LGFGRRSLHHGAYILYSEVTAKVTLSFGAFEVESIDIFGSVVLRAPEFSTLRVDFTSDITTKK